MKRLDDFAGYVTGELTGADADALEEAMFDAPDDPDLAIADRIARHGRQLAAHGTFDMGVTRRHIDELIAAGHTVQILDAGPPGSGTLTIDAHSQLIATRIQLGRTDLERVDVEMEMVELGVAKTIRDVFVDRSEGAIYGLCERALAEMAFGTGRAIVRVFERDGAKAKLAEWDLVGLRA